MISVIVPNYNHREFLPQRLDTIFNQTFQDFEVILLDDCSMDGSWEYLIKFDDHPKVSHCIRNEFNSGSPFKQWKRGIELAKYDWIWIAESDDFSESNFLESCVSRINEHVSLVFVKSEFVDHKGAPLYFNGIKHEMKSYDLGETEFRKNGKEFISQFLTYRNYILNASSVLFKKQSSFPDEIITMKFAGDWYFWIQLLKKGDVIYLFLPKNYFRFHLNTTRVIREEKIELERFSEDIKCVRLALSISKKNLFVLINDQNFHEMVNGHFRLRFKYGRLRLFSLFPKMPLFFYPIYYKFFLKSLISRR